MTVEQFVNVSGEVYVIDALAEYLPSWLVDLIHSRGDAIGGLTVQDVAPIVEVRDTKNVTLELVNVAARVLELMPEWWSQHAEEQGHKVWAQLLALEIVNALREALERTAEGATVEYHVEVSMLVNGELIESDSYEGEDFADALYTVEQFADRI